MPSAPPQRDDDHEQARAAIGGDAHALDALWRRHRGWLAAVLAAHAPRGLDPEDLLQETAFAFVRGISRLQAPGALRAWLRTIAVHVAVSAARAHGRRREQPVATDDLETPTRAGQTSVDDRESLREAIARLEPDLREALLLRCLRCLSQREIAETLEIPETTVETRLARARRRLRGLLSDFDLPARRPLQSQGERPWK